jgi:hypothetical protein
VGDVLQHDRPVDQLTVRRAHMKWQREGRTGPLHPDAKAAIAAWLMTLRQRTHMTPQTYMFQSRKGEPADQPPAGLAHPVRGL